MGQVGLGEGGVESTQLVWSQLSEAMVVPKDFLAVVANDSGVLRKREVWERTPWDYFGHCVPLTCSEHPAVVASSYDYLPYGELG